MTTTPNDDMRRISPSDLLIGNNTSEQALRAPAEADADVKASCCPICEGVGVQRTGQFHTEPDGRRVYETMECSCKTITARREAREAERSRLVLARLRDELGELADRRFDTFDLKRKVEPQSEWPQMAQTFGRGRQERSLQLAFDLARRFAAHPDGFLVMIGPTGSGKSHLAAAWAWELLERDIEVRYCSVPELLGFIVEGIREDEVEERIAAFKTVSALVIDDVSAAHLDPERTPWKIEALFRIINARANGNRPTFLTSNRSIEDLPPHIATRIFGQVRTLEPEIWLVASDYRRLHHSITAS